MVHAYRTVHACGRTVLAKRNNIQMSSKERLGIEAKLAKLINEWGQELREERQRRQRDNEDVVESIEKD